MRLSYLVFSTDLTEAKARAAALREEGFTAFVRNPDRFEDREGEIEKVDCVILLTEAPHVAKAYRRYGIPVEGAGCDPVSGDAALAGESREPASESASMSGSESASGADLMGPEAQGPTPSEAPSKHPVNLDHVLSGYEGEHEWLNGMTIRECQAWVSRRSGKPVHAQRGERTLVREMLQLKAQGK